MLNEVYWNMVQKSGFCPVSEMSANADSGKGNTDYLKLTIGGMKKQPCNPTFVQARDAIVAANDAIFRGRYKCEIWNAFSKRGLGPSAKDDGAYQNDFSKQSGC
jgi:hypothetical protein